jgi:hypothetical protein
MTRPAIAFAAALALAGCADDATPVVMALSARPQPITPGCDPYAKTLYVPGKPLRIVGEVCRQAIADDALDVLAGGL